MGRDAMRRFVEAEIVPKLEQLEHGDMPPYDILRKLYSTFGIDELNRSRFDSMIAKARARERGEGGHAQRRPQVHVRREAQQQQRSWQQTLGCACLDADRSLLLAGAEAQSAPVAFRVAARVPSRRNRSGTRLPPLG